MLRITNERHKIFEMIEIYEIQNLVLKNFIGRSIGLISVRILSSAQPTRPGPADVPWAVLQSQLLRLWQHYAATNKKDCGQCRETGKNHHGCNGRWLFDSKENTSLRQFNNGATSCHLHIWKKESPTITIHCIVH